VVSGAESSKSAVFNFSYVVVVTPTGLRIVGDDEELDFDGGL